MELEYDVVVIGAGLQGLVAAKTFLQVQPNLRLLILESRTTIGGVWAKENQYPGLLANNMLGTYECTDLPMAPSLALEPGQHIAGEAIHEYLQHYCGLFGLQTRLRCQNKVHGAERTRTGWTLQVADWDKKPPEDYSIACRKLIIATGLNSEPQSLEIKGASSFGKPCLSFAQYPQYAKMILGDSTVSDITVCGGSKAAHDIVYTMAAQGKRVLWIIRDSGYGPTPMAPSYLGLGPFRIWTEKFLTTRPITWLSPCIFSHIGGFGSFQKFLQETGPGNWIIRKVLRWLSACLFDQSGLSAYPETRKLMPDVDLLWYGSSSAILNYPTNFYELIRKGQVQVIRKEISYLEKDNTIKFTDGSEATTDAIVCCTGWKHVPNISFHPSSIHASIGIPSNEYTRSQTAQWAMLDNRADSEILERLPILLRNRPKEPHQLNAANTNLYTSWRLWRGIAPPSTGIRDVVFLGMMTCPQTVLRAEISALWAYAYVFDKLDEPVVAIGTQPPRRINNHEEKLYDTAIFQRYGFWRTPYGHGAKHADAVFEGLPYFDMLLQDLGLCNWRKGWGWLGEIFGGGYWQKDYQGLVQEWMEKQNYKDAGRSELEGS